MKAMTHQDLIDIEMEFFPWQKGADLLVDEIDFTQPEDFMGAMFATDLTDKAIEEAITDIN
jgi:hypothetical protein